MHIIGVAGNAQMGKDSLSDRLAEQLNKKLGKQFWTRAAYAYNVKRVFCEAFDVDSAFIEKWKVTEEIPPNFDIPIRKALQFIGDGFRTIRSSIWIDFVFNNNIPKIISDNRYLNESQRVREEGGINILIGRPDRISDDLNPSEAELRPYITWCLNQFPKEDKLVDLRNLQYLSKDNCPEKMYLFDFFVRNDEDIDCLYKMIDDELVPLVSKINFIPEY